MALQEKEEQCIGLQMDNENLKDQLVKMKYERERVNSESLNFQNTINHLEQQIKKLNHQMNQHQQSEQSLKSLLSEYESKIEDVSRSERSQAKQNLARYKQQFESQLKEQEHKSKLENDSLRSKLRQSEEKARQIHNQLCTERDQRDHTTRQLSNILKDKFTDAIKTVELQSKAPSEVGWDVGRDFRSFTPVPEIPEFSIQETKSPAKSLPSWALEASPEASKFKVPAEKPPKKTTKKQKSKPSPVKNTSAMRNLSFETDATQYKELPNITDNDLHATSASASSVLGSPMLGKPKLESSMLEEVKPLSSPNVKDAKRNILKSSRKELVNSSLNSIISRQSKETYKTKSKSSKENSFGNESVQTKDLSYYLQKLLDIEEKKKRSHNNSSQKLESINESYGELLATPDSRKIKSLQSSPRKNKVYNETPTQSLDDSHIQREDVRALVEQMLAEGKKLNQKSSEKITKRASEPILR